MARTMLTDDGSQFGVVSPTRAIEHSAASHLDDVRWRIFEAADSDIVFGQTTFLARGHGDCLVHHRGNCA
jgi:hypothetical protein